MLMSNFNPRSHEGSDLTVRNFCILQTLFQSTLPRGERRVTARISWTCGEFQSTLPRGERHGGRERCTGNARFQSTLPRGERLAKLGNVILGGISIHAPTRGATLLLFILASHTKFQSTLPRGERPPSGTSRHP